MKLKYFIILVDIVTIITTFIAVSVCWEIKRKFPSENGVSDTYTIENHTEIVTENPKTEQVTTIYEVETTAEATEPPQISLFKDRDVYLIAQTLYGECRGCSDAQREAVCWTILNRVDAGWGTIENVITSPGQFHGYNAANPVCDDLYYTAEKILTLWEREKNGETVNRVLPPEYIFFDGDGTINHFRKTEGGKEYAVG